MTSYSVFPARQCSTSQHKPFPALALKMCGTSLTAKTNSNNQWPVSHHKKMVCVKWQVGSFKTFSCTTFTSHNSESKDYHLFSFWTLLQHRSLNDDAIKQQTSQKTSSRDVWILWLCCEAKLLGCVILCLFFISTEVFLIFPVTRQNWCAHGYIECNWYGGHVG